MNLQVFSAFCNIMQCGKVFSVGVQFGNDMRLVLILIATDNH